MFNKYRWKKYKRNPDIGKIQMAIEELAYGLSLKWPSVHDRNKSERFKKMAESHAFKTIMDLGKRLPIDIQPPTDIYRAMAWINLLTSSRAEDILKSPMKL